VGASLSTFKVGLSTRGAATPYELNRADEVYGKARSTPFGVGRRETSGAGRPEGNDRPR
jgi:hypothetical protein